MSGHTAAAASGWGRSRRGAADGSGRREQGAEELGEHGDGPQAHGDAFSSTRLEIAQEAVEQRMGDEQKEPQAGDRGGVVMEVVISMPLSAQLIEPLVLNAPAFMAKENNGLRRDFCGGQCGDPDPLGSLLTFDPLAADSFADGFGFEAAHDANLFGEGLPGVQVFDIP